MPQPLTDNLDYLATLLQRTVPGIGPVIRLEHVAAGYGATTLRDMSGLTIRIPHSTRLARRQQVTASALRRLAPHLPAAIPVLLWLLPVGYPFETGAIAYQWIDGEQIETAEASPALIEQVGTFLARLHGIEGELLDTFDGRVPGATDVNAERDRVMSIALPWLRKHLAPSDLARVESWWHGFQESQAAAPYEPRLVHGDFWHGNLLVDTTRQHLTGVIDWENIALDDPAQDLATLLHGGKAFSNAVLAAYRAAGGLVDTATLTRRDRHWEYRELTGIVLALEIGDESEAVEALHKLRHGALRHLFAEQPPE